MAYEIRPLSFAEILDTGFRILREQFRPLMTLVGVLYGPAVFFGGSMWLAVRGVVMAGAPPDLGRLAAVAPWLLIAGVLLVLWMIVAWPVTVAATTHVVGEAYLGRPVDVRAALHAGWSMMMPLAGTSLLMSMMVMLGFLLLIVPGLYLLLSYALVWQVMVLERVYGMAALRRSARLATGHRLRILAVWLVVSVLGSVVGGGLQFVLGYLPGLGMIASLTVQAVSTAFATAVLVVFYFDIRCRKEAFDLEHLARLVAARLPPSSPALSVPAP